MSRKLIDPSKNKKDPTKRNYQTIGVFGTTGVGKSTTLDAFIDWYRDGTKNKEVPRKILLIDPSNAIAFRNYEPITLGQIMYGVKDPATNKVRSWRSGIRVLRGVQYSRNFEWVKVISDFFRNGLLILDESRTFVDNVGTLNPDLLDMITKHRNDCYDIMFISHSYIDLHKSIRKQLRFFFIFPMGSENINSPKDFEKMNLPSALWDIYQLQRADRAKESATPLQKRVSSGKKVQNIYLYDLDRDQIGEIVT
jgi:Zonular occludens toxin (Zot)